VSALCLQTSCGARVVVMDSWVIVLVLGLIAAYALVRLVLRHYFPPDT
jgi:hypothetical protein